MDGNRSAISFDEFHAWLGPVLARALASGDVWVVELSARASEPLTSTKF